MVRLSGKSTLYLPTEYAPCALILPTCIRATAQHVAQNANTRGIFRIPGSMKVVGAIFDYYCHVDKSGGDISGTVRAATLPLHIQYSVHDIASTLKRLLSTLPGGILGSLLLFDAFIAIQSNLNAEPEFPRTNQTKVRARLIALAIGTIESQYKRELICAIFGLLSMIGRIAEVAPREDESGLPLPTTDLMGYGALSICFGPLLVGDLLQSYTMKIAAPNSGLLVLPPASHQVRKETRRPRSASSTKSVQPAVDKILIANRVTEMLISNWRDIVRQMKSLGTHRRRHTSGGSFSKPLLRPSASETFLTKLPKDYSKLKSPSDTVLRAHNELNNQPNRSFDSLPPQSTNASKRGSSFLKPKASVNTLSPTIEEKSPASRAKEDVIEEEPGAASAAAASSSQPAAQIGMAAEGTQTEMITGTGSPIRRKRFTVPPRLSSIDSGANFKMMEVRQSNDFGAANDEDKTPQDKHKQLPKRANSGDDTPPQFYSPVITARTPIAEEFSKHASAAQDQENWKNPARTVLESMSAPRRNSAQSPATDSKYQLKRYKRDDGHNFTGSPVKGKKKPRLTTVPGNALGAANADTNHGDEERIPFKGNPKKLRRSRSGPVREMSIKKEDDVFRPPQCSPAGVWRNGVPQKSPPTKVLRSSVSDGVSLRASAIRSLINAGKNRIRQSHGAEKKYDDFESTSWSKCSRFTDERPKSVIRHLNMYHGFDIPPDHVHDSENAQTLYRIIISLHDELMKQRRETSLLRKGIKSPQRDDAGRLMQDVRLWKHRAEVAEKRIQVFEKFTERLKEIRDAALLFEQSELISNGDQGWMSTGNLKLDKDFVAAAARVRFAEIDGNDEQSVLGRSSADSKRSSSCVGCARRSLDSKSTEDEGKAGLRPRPASFDEVAELWMAAKELLDGSRGDDD